jgi:hypothetical protein
MVVKSLISVQNGVTTVSVIGDLKNSDVTDEKEKRADQPF